MINLAKSVGFALLLPVFVHAQTSVPPPPASPEEPKFALLAFAARQAAGTAFSSLMRWAATRYLAANQSSAPAAPTNATAVANAPVKPEMAIPLGASRGISVTYAGVSTEGNGGAWVETPASMLDGASQFPPSTLIAASTRALYAATPIIQGAPDVPMQVSKAVAPNEWSGANYAGINVAMVLLDESKSVREVSALTRPLRNGARFRLQVTSTFDALIALESGNIHITRDEFTRTTPWQGRIYPQALDRVVKASANEVVSLPLGANEYFVYDEASSADALLLHVRHPQAVGSQASAQPIYRQDGPQGTLYLQLASAGSWPALSQPIAIRPPRARARSPSLSPASNQAQ